MKESHDSHIRVSGDDRKTKTVGVVVCVVEPLVLATVERVSASKSTTTE